MISILNVCCVLIAHCLLISSIEMLKNIFWI